MATIDLTADSFSQAVSDNSILFVDFWAAWCGPCRAFAPVYTSASAAHAEIAFGKVDTENEQSLAGAAGISSIPTLMAFRDQILVFSQPGALSGPQLEEVISAVTSLDMDEVRSTIKARSAATPGA
ncbi:thioredoxin [Cryobacterium sp. MLB-32]|uniref:thioredoxin family protein n=1 Tax=Cryobacterium sp. MLB-32 TaxID=1529318 RepID=UPI0004E61FC5|nr:thioredoxin family protein [Cryobacterium sp. MLB-32]KFF59693.1 thioredoxin [Cryobacterium sp. MLB-32]